MKISRIYSSPFLNIQRRSICQTDQVVCAWHFFEICLLLLYISNINKDSKTICVGHMCISLRYTCYFCTLTTLTKSSLRTWLWSIIIIIIAARADSFSHPCKSRNTCHRFRFRLCYQQIQDWCKFVCQKDSTVCHICVDLLHKRPARSELHRFRRIKIREHRVVC